MSTRRLRLTILGLCASVLLATLAVMSSRGTSYRLRLVESIERNDRAAVQAYIEQGGHVDDSAWEWEGNTSGSRTLLYFAAKSGAHDVAEYLVNAGASTTYERAVGHPGLQAVARDDGAMLSLLLHGGMDPLSPVSGGNSLLAEALLCSRWRAATVLIDCLPPTAAWHPHLRIVRWDGPSCDRTRFVQALLRHVPLDSDLGGGSTLRALLEALQDRQIIDAMHGVQNAPLP